jgi:hypothetical protein
MLAKGAAAELDYYGLIYEPRVGDEVVCCDSHGCPSVGLVRGRKYEITHVNLIKRRFTRLISIPDDGKLVYTIREPSI